jgi:transcriptional regulator
MSSSEPPVPGARGTTVRGALKEALRTPRSDELRTAKDLSAAVGIREKDVAEHLQHLERSLKPEGLRLQVEPAECLACGFVFRERTRLTRPGACPRCRSTRIDPPAFRIAG